jgi:hypothetical protein
MMTSARVSEKRLWKASSLFGVPLLIRNEIDFKPMDKNICTGHSSGFACFWLTIEFAHNVLFSRYMALVQKAEMKQLG